MTHPVRIPDLPSPGQRDRLASVIVPLRALTKPKLYGLEHVPRDGALFVGNHTIYGFLDLPFMMAELWSQKGVTVRGLGEHAHYSVPGWRELLEVGGMVRGTRANVRELMRRGENVLVFPGGAREVNKRRGEKYRLMWKERLGFARLAIEHSYPILPFAAVGAEEMLDVVIDDTNPVYAKLATAIKRLTGLPVPPIVKGIGPTPIPRPQRLYFWFGEPIRTRRWAGLEEDVKAQRAVRDQVKDAIESGIEFLLAERALEVAQLRSRGEAQRPVHSTPPPDARSVS